MHRPPVRRPAAAGPRAGRRVQCAVLGATSRVAAQSLLTPAVVVVASPANPTGTMLLPQELAALARWCDEHAVQLVSDEIYHGIEYADPPMSSSAWETSREVVVFSSFAAVFEGPSTLDEQTFESHLWARLNALHRLDAERFPWSTAVSFDPAAPNFGFSLGGHAFFIVGLHPGSSRTARLENRSHEIRDDER